MNQKMACKYLSMWLRLFFKLCMYKIGDTNLVISPPECVPAKYATYVHTITYIYAKALAVRCVAGNFIHTKSSKYS